MVSSLLQLPLFLLLLAASSPKGDAQHNKNISLGQSIPAADGSSWASASGRFAFGFYKRQGGLGIGVWLNTYPTRTIVWTANRDDPPITGGSISLTLEGRLLWIAPDGGENPIYQQASAVLAAAMLDNGNFVLYNMSMQVVWSTFSNPTNTLLPGQNFLPGSQLFSDASEDDQSTGNFRLSNQMDGNLVLYPARGDDNLYYAYWSSHTDLIGFQLTLFLDDNGHLYLSGSNSKYNRTLKAPNPSTSLNSTDTIYQAKLDLDGIFRLYSYTITANRSYERRVEWAATDDRCLVNGICGPNSYCTNGDDGNITCHCPPGFEFLDPSKTSIGCRKTFAGDCTNNSFSSTSMVEMERMIWMEDRYYDKLSLSLDDCRQACLKDCFCEAALHSSGLCKKQTLPLMYGRSGSSDTIFIKVALPNLSNQQVLMVTKKSWHTYALVTGVVLAGFSFCLFVVSLLILCKIRHLGRYYRITEKDSIPDDEIPVVSYSYAELKKATENFKQEIGKGAFGTVFKGALMGGKKTIAVKRLDKLIEDGEREFQREVKAIGRTNHKNLVRLLGFCNEGIHRLLVYEFMSNGSLASLLFKGEEYPNWDWRVQIGIDVARGLLYLHEEVDKHIIHCDIKPENILMDESGTAKIADFGLAKLLMPDQTKAFTEIRGTRGYLAPEWSGNSAITVKADVYSFGVVLLELVCCKRSTKFREGGLHSTLSEWAYDCLVGGELNSLIGDEDVDGNELERMVRIGLWCTQNEPVTRSSMKDVILMLEGNKEAPYPPPPSSFTT